MGPSGLKPNNPRAVLKTPLSRLKAGFSSISADTLVKRCFRCAEKGGF